MAHVDIVFVGGPGSDAPRFVEVEDEQGKSIRFGTWVRRIDGYWVLRITEDQRVGRAQAAVDQTRRLAGAEPPPLLRRLLDQLDSLLKEEVQHG